MSIYAKIENNLVTNFIVCEDEDIFMVPGNYLKCSEDGSIRYNYPSPGYSYDSENDAFIPPKPFESWILNSSFKWEAPVAKPEGTAAWDEENKVWNIAE